MRNRLLLLGVASAVALLLAAPALAEHGDSPNVDGATDDSETGQGELTAVIADASLTGRTITTVTDAVAEVFHVDDSTPVTLSAGVPGTVTVTEVAADGVHNWYVNLGLDDDLKDAGDVVVRTKDKVSITSSTVAAVTLPLVNTVAATDVASDTALGSPATLFYATNQVGGTDYTGTYTSTVNFKVDVTDYTGDIKSVAADYTVTLYQ